MKLQAEWKEDIRIQILGECAPLRHEKYVLNIKITAG
jgi:hypothetical protein